jgi:hypothetical protein
MLKKMSADEVHSKTIFDKKSSDKNKVKFITNFVCTNARKILPYALGSKGSSLQSCLNVLTTKQLEKIKCFALHMHDAYINIVVKTCTNAKNCIDRLHLEEGVNKVFDEVIKIEFKKAKGN